MAEITCVQNVKLFFGILFSSHEVLLNVIEELKEIYGEFDYKSQVFPFTLTDYYNNEMGNNISRIFYSFKELISPEEIGHIKIKSNIVENTFSFHGKRMVNLDPGYMDYHKIVLASAKFGGQKIYIGNGIYADITLWYEKGIYKPFPWTFLDFKNGLYDRVFLDIRQIYKGQIRDFKG